MQQRLVRRKETQPLQFPNAGSCFRNPEGDRAGRLIEAAGAKGWRVGGAEVSRLHANFIVNVDGATAQDVTTLLARVRRAVHDQFAVDLELEVHLVGEFVCDVSCGVQSVGSPSSWAARAPNARSRSRAGTGVMRALEAWAIRARSLDFDNRFVENDPRDSSRTSCSTRCTVPAAKTARFKASWSGCGLPYTGSGILGCALAMDKHLTKKILSAEGLPTPNWDAYDLGGGTLPLLPGSLDLAARRQTAQRRLERRRDAREDARTVDASDGRASTRTHNPQVLAEEYIAGREFSCGVLGEEALPVVEIVAGDEFYSLRREVLAGRKPPSVSRADRRGSRRAPAHARALGAPADRLARLLAHRLHRLQRRPAVHPRGQRAPWAHAEQPDPGRSRGRSGSRTTRSSTAWSATRSAAGPRARTQAGKAPRTKKSGWYPGQLMDRAARWKLPLVGEGQQSMREARRASRRTEHQGNARSPCASISKAGRSRSTPASSFSTTCSPRWPSMRASV